MITLIRGLPGSGKSTLAKALVKKNGGFHIEADMFFLVEGVYVYDQLKIKDAHTWCQAMCKELLSKGNSVVVSNTFVKVWEMQAYFDMGYPVEVLTATGKFSNVHGVPPEVIKRMATNWETYPKEKVIV